MSRQVASLTFCNLEMAHFRVSVSEISRSLTGQSRVHVKKVKSPCRL